MAPHVLLYVQHLLGSGHLRRAALVARALEAAGLRVTLASGGPPVVGLDLGGAGLVQLPPVRALDPGFRRLAGPHGAPFDETLRAARRARLLQAFESTAPQAVVVETFPFGRRAFRGELLALLEAAAARRPRPFVVCSVRDVLQTGRKPERVAETVGTVRRYFDAVLVHGDPRLVGFEETFPRTGDLADLIVYTGFVAEPPPSPRSAAPTPAEVVVSAGGGAVGEALLETAMPARELTPLARAPWRLLAGESAREPWLRKLRERAPAGVAVERHRTDFPGLLATARLSISQAGYNTVLDVLAAGVPAVLVPFARGGQTEQSLRAARLAERRLAVALPEEALGPESLARAVEAASALRRERLELDLSGAETTARLLAGWLAAQGNRAVDPEMVHGLGGT